MKMQTESRERFETTPFDVVYRNGTLRLLRFKSRRSRSVVEPVVVCFSLVNRPYILDFEQRRSVVRRLLDAGIDVFLIDWGRPNEEDHTLELSDYVCRLLNESCEFACRTAPSSQVTLLGYCMGGTMASMYAALHPQRVRNLLLMATPIDFSRNEGLVTLLAQQEFFDVDQLIDTFRNCPDWFLQLCFQMMKPIRSGLVSYRRLTEHREDTDFLSRFIALESWANDSIPVAGETFRQFVKLLYQENQLFKGELRLRDQFVDLKQITCPVLTLIAERDHLVPPNSSRALHQLLPQAESMSADVGHIGLAVSSRAHSQFWPGVATWITKHSTQYN